jgi:hypothetical protein
MFDRTGGGIGRIDVEKSFQRSSLTDPSQLALNWLTKNTEYRQTAPAPAYHPGDAVTFEAGVTFFRELYTDCRFTLSGSVVFLPSDIRDSPLVDRSQVFSSFLAVTRQF